MNNTIRRTSFFIASLFILMLFISAKKVDQGILHWSANRRLTFADFKGKPAEAITDTLHNNLTHRLGSISKGILVNFKSQGGSVVFTVYAGMKKDSSWIRNADDTITLKHEQGHFDICERYARILRKELLKAHSLSEAKSIYDNILIKEEREQDRFDTENTYKLGGITAAWSMAIASQLKSLAAYEKPVLLLTLKN